MTRNIDAMGRVTVSIRGAEPRHTLILIDGQPVLGDFAKYSGAGDELQGIKKGIMELADAIVINKADGDNLLKAKVARGQ